MAKVTTFGIDEDGLLYCQEMETPNMVPTVPTGEEPWFPPAWVHPTFEHGSRVDVAFSTVANRYAAKKVVFPTAEVFCAKVNGLLGG